MDLVIRRTYPRPVTFADLRRAYGKAYDVRWRFRSAFMHEWHAALKVAAGATDDVYAVIDGREVKVATVPSSDVATWQPMAPVRTLAGGVFELLHKADTAGYWERPHEVRVSL